jgi:hypothetical protein
LKADKIEANDKLSARLGWLQKLEPLAIETFGHIAINGSYMMIDALHVTL